jgi:hypothetical protein
LDPYSSDFINLRYIGTYFCILNSKVCSDIDEQQIKHSAAKYSNYFEGGNLSKEEFIKIPMWFDTDEDSLTLPSNINKIIYSV